MRRLFVMMGILGLAICMITAVAPAPATAITAEEMLEDPTLEARARALSKELRCLVCQNQSIDDSDAELAQDLRREVRSQLLAGADDDAILENVRSKYGDYVLLRPPVTTGTYLLWFSPVVIVAIGGAILFVAWRNRSRRPSEPAVDASADITADTTANPANGPVTDTISNPGTDSPQTPPDRLMMIAVGALILAGSLGLYLMLGRADLADQPLANRQSEIAAATAEVTAAQTTAAANLEAAQAQVTANPNSVAEWLNLAMAATAAGDSPTEIAALEQALAITDGDSAIKAMLAEALSRAANGQITIPARALIAEALTANSDEPRALFLSGLAAYQDEDYAKAVAIWQRLQAISTPDAPWFTLLGENIADAATKGGISLPPISAGPSAADVAAAAEMNATDRQAMIETMVAGLAERLADNPDDADGWLRLARAYDVLGRPVDSAKAFINAGDAAPTSIDTQITALEYVASNAVGDGLTDAIDRLLARMARLDPDRLELLFFSGHFARERGDVALAAQNWQRLIDKLPTDSPFTAELQEAIASLNSDK